MKSRDPVLQFNIMPPEPLVVAATLLPLVKVDGTLNLLLTVRTDKVQHHKGQICFPGGVKESGESLWDAALREAREEVGLPQDLVVFVDELPQVLTPTSFVVTPFVGLIESDFNQLPLEINRDEIEKVFLVPIEHLCRPENLRVEEREYFGKNYPVPFFTYDEHTIWGATGRMVLDFLERYRNERWRETLLAKLIF